MVNFLFTFLIASLLGFLAGMGVGGGSLLLLWLTQVAMLEHTQARIINLLFFLPAAFLATLFRKKQNLLEPGITLPAIVCGCAAAIVFSRISTFLNVDQLKKLLGVLLIFTGIREVFYRPRKAK